MDAWLVYWPVYIWQEFDLLLTAQWIGGFILQICFNFFFQWGTCHQNGYDVFKCTDKYDFTFYVKEKWMCEMSPYFGNKNNNKTKHSHQIKI